MLTFTRFLRHLVHAWRVTTPSLRLCLEVWEPTAPVLKVQSPSFLAVVVIDWYRLRHFSLGLTCRSQTASFWNVGARHDESTILASSAVFYPVRRRWLPTRSMPLDRYCYTCIPGLFGRIAGKAAGRAAGRRTTDRVVLAGGPCSFETKDHDYWPLSVVGLTRVFLLLQDLHAFKRPTRRSLEERERE